MKYLLDTNICIAIIKQQPDAVLKRLKKCQPGDVAVSAITVAELRYGASKSQAIARNHQSLNQFLVPLEIVDFDEQCAQVYGDIRADLEKQGTPIGSLDTLIAAQAIAYRLKLVSNNLREFKRIKALSLENWL